MTTKLVMQGDDMVVFIPYSLMEDVGIADGSQLDISSEDGEIRITVSGDSSTAPEDIASLQGCVSFTQEEIDADPRLSYILSR